MRVAATRQQYYNINMPGKEDKSAMMHQINSNLSHQLSAGSSQAGSQHQKDTIRRAKTRTESSSSTMASKTRRRLSGECLFFFSFSLAFFYENNTLNLVLSIFHMHRMPKKRGLRGFGLSRASSPPLRSAYLPVDSCYITQIYVMFFFGASPGST